MAYWPVKYKFIISFLSKYKCQNIKFIQYKLSNQAQVCGTTGTCAYWCIKMALFWNMSSNEHSFEL